MNAMATTPKNSKSKLPLRNFELTKEQRRATLRAVEALKRGSEIIAVAGPAGCGKTTIIQELKDQLGASVVISAMTNKATEVLRRKGLITAITTYKACLVPNFREPAEALLAYLSMDDEEGSEQESTLIAYFDYDLLQQSKLIARQLGLSSGMRVIGIDNFFRDYFDCWGARPKQDGVLIIDEASMLGEELLATIRQSFSKIILVGDEYQLPPVKDRAVFWDDRIVNHRIHLSEVHRQASNSQPLELATLIRQGHYIPMHATTIDTSLCAAGMPVIVWRNEVRIELSKAIRYALGYIGASPEVGEVLVCRENHKIGKVDFVNNSMWTVVATNGGDGCILEDGDGQRTQEYVEVHMEEYGSGRGLSCRYAYALTCHSAQGSEWPIVMIHADDARCCLGRDRDRGRNWLYTAVTRAQKRIIWVSSTIE